VAAHGQDASFRLPVQGIGVGRRLPFGVDEPAGRRLLLSVPLDPHLPLGSHRGATSKLMGTGPPVGQAKANGLVLSRGARPPQGAIR